MPILLVLLAITAGIYRDDIKGIDSYSFSVQNPAIIYELRTLDENNNTKEELNYIPNVSSFTGLSFSKGPIELSVVYQNRDDNKKIAEESELFDIQLMGTFNKHLWQIYYQNYHGLYITDNDIVTADLPRVNAYSYGASMKHFTRDGYIVDRSYSNFMLEKETNWSPFVGAFINRSSLYTNENLIPSLYQANFSELDGIRAINSFNLGISGGITGMYFHEGFYISGSFSYNVQYQQQEFFGIEDPTREVTSNGSEGLGEVGYQWDRNTAGLQIRIRSINAPVKNAEFRQSTTLSQVYYKYFF